MLGGGIGVRASRGECSRYRGYLHKAIVFPLLRARLPRTWRGCHSALGPLSSAFSHISRGSGAPLYIYLRVFFSASSSFPSRRRPILFLLVPSISNLPTAGGDRTPCLRYLACIPAYNYTGLRLCISCVTFALSLRGREPLPPATELLLPRFSLGFRCTFFDRG